VAVSVGVVFMPYRIDGTPRIGQHQNHPAHRD
jgi:hypothetical protein